MNHLKIILNGDGAMPELQGKRIHTGVIDAITGLPGGMKSGKTSVALVLGFGWASFHP